MNQDWDTFETEDRGWSKRRRLVIGCISLVLVAALLLSAVSSALWLIEVVRSESGSNEVDNRSSNRESDPPLIAEETESDVISTTPLPDETEAGPDAPVSTSTPFVPTLNRIAFINREGQLETMDPTGGERHQLTDTDRRFQFPAWSPDGQYVASIGGNRSGAGVYLLQDSAEIVEPDERYFSRTQNPFYLYWSPDSQQISFLANHPENALALHVAPAAGEIDDRVLATGSPFYWQWTADSAELLIHSGANSANSRIALIDAAGEVSEEAVAPVPGMFQAPSISADGRYWAYAAFREEGSSWMTVRDTDSGETFDQRHAGVVAMGWSPTANQLAIISGPPESQRFYGPLRLLNAETGETDLLSRETVLAFFWSPNGRYLAYLSTTLFNDDVQASVTARKVQARVRPVQSNERLFTLHMLDLESGTDRTVAVFQPTFTFLSQFLPYFDQYTLSHRLWSPDSTSLVLPVRQEGRNRIVVFSALDEPMRELAFGDMPFWSQQ